MDDVIKALNQGGVALLPTDTVYGLAALPTRPSAVKRIFELKGRPASKNLAVLAANSEQIASLGVKTDGRVLALLESRFVPGALTMVLPVTAAAAPSWLAGRTEVAVRIPRGEALQKILLQTGPLLATSANTSGMTTAAEVPQILAQLSGAPDILINDGPRTGEASTLIDCQTEPFRVIRRGALAAADIKEILAL